MSKLKEEIKSILEKSSIDRNIIELKDLPDPTLIPNLSLAANRIIERLNNGDKLLIVGDYDCDGIAGTTIVKDFFNKLGYESVVDYIVPDRFVDGYGVSINMINYAIDNMFDFIVTVDNGIGAYDAIEYANKKGVEVIITDHHTVGEKIPNASIIVNLKYEQGNFPFLEISGATVAWYLCSQINRSLNANIDMKQWLDLVGITVISDVMPLKSLNVSLARYAIKAIKNKSRFLFELVFDFNDRKHLNESDIGFKFVPMINAVGRLDHAKNAIEILLSNDKTFVREGYHYLVETNNRRKKLTQELLSSIIDQAEEQAENRNKAIIVKSEGLHEGIVGILAGKLAEKYMRPAYVFGYNHAKKCWKGSGRTSGSVNLYKLTKKAESEVIGFGGHAGAVGVALSEENLDKWSKIICHEAEKIEGKDFLPLGENPIEVQLSDIDNDLLSLLDQYRPFGEGFPSPVFKSNVFLSITDSYTDGLHSKCIIIDNEGTSAQAWFFHDRNISLYNNQEVKAILNPVKTHTKQGEIIAFHGEINYLDR